MPDSEPKLKEAKITFTTPDGKNDKDEDTKLQVTLFSNFANGFVRKIAFSPFHVHALFGQDSVNTIELPLQGSVGLGSIEKTRVRIEIQPTRQESWRFRYELELKFDDGTVLTKSSGGDKHLSDGNRVLEE